MRFAKLTSMFLFVLSLLLLCNVSYADNIIIGAPRDNGNLFPFGEPYPGYTGTRYQQAYDASGFSSLGPINITGISFFPYNEASFREGTYDLYLSTITADIDSLSILNFDDNRGSDNALFATANLSGSFAGSIFTFSGGPFSYDPTAGNLLLDIVITNIGNNGYLAFDNRTTAVGIFSRYHNFGEGFEGYGLVTQFDYDSAPIPEPTSLLLFGTGLGLLGLTAYRRKKK